MLLLDKIGVFGQFTRIIDKPGPILLAYLCALILRYIIRLFNYEYRKNNHCNSKLSLNFK